MLLWTASFARRMRGRRRGEIEIIVVMTDWNLAEIICVAVAQEDPLVPIHTLHPKSLAEIFKEELA